jgi:hypothetical protein
MCAVGSFSSTFKERRFPHPFFRASSAGRRIHVNCLDVESGTQLAISMLMRSERDMHDSEANEGLDRGLYRSWLGHKGQRSAVIPISTANLDQ